MEKVLKFRSYFLIILFALLLGACKEDEENDDSDPEISAGEIYLSGSVTIAGEPVGNGSFTVNDYFSEASVNEGTFDMSTVGWEGLPQLLYVTDDNDNVVMLNKSFDTFKQIDEESTAFALLSLNPIFSNLKTEEYLQVIDYIKNMPSYPRYYSEISRSVKLGRDIFDENNISLKESLHLLIQDIFKADEDVSRAIDGIIDDKDTKPIIVTSEGVTICLRVVGLNPTYEVTVNHDAKIFAEPQLIKSRPSFGVMDLINLIGEGFVDWGMAWDDAHLGEPLMITLDSDGQYDFICDRNSERAIKDLQIRMIGDLLGAFSLPGDEAIWNDPLANLELQREFMAMLASSGGEPNVNDLLGLIVDKVINKNIDKYIKNLKGEFEIAGKNFDKKAFANGLNMLLSALTGIGQEVLRGFWGLNANTDIMFCVSKQSNTIQKCQNSDIYILAGDKQIGKPGKTLPLELKVGVNATFGSRVRFEVTNGGGRVEKEFANIRTGDDGNFYATNEWTLGEEGTQTVDAYIVNQDGTKASLSVRFTASFEEEGDLLMSVGDFLTFKYDSQGRPEVVSFRYDDYSEKATFTYNSESIIPSKIVSFTSDQTLSYNAVWSNFKASKDGKRIESFQWTEDGDRGNVTIKYDIDDRIVSIIDRATDGNTKTTFYWDGLGRLEKSQTIENDPEEPVNYTISYLYDNPEANPTHMYPFAMCIDQPWFFMTGLFGEGPSLLPTQRNAVDEWDSESNMTLGLEYGIGPSEKISYEKISFGPIVETMPYTYGSVSRGNMDFESGMPTLPGFDKRSRKAIKRIGHARR